MYATFRINNHLSTLNSMTICNTANNKKHVPVQRHLHNVFCLFLEKFAARTRERASSIKLLFTMFKQNELSNTAVFVVDAGNDTTKSLDANAKGNMFVYNIMFNNNNHGPDQWKTPVQCVQCPSNEAVRTNSRRRN